MLVWILDKLAVTFVVSLYQALGCLQGNNCNLVIIFSLCQSDMPLLCHSSAKPVSAAHSSAAKHRKEQKSKMMSGKMGAQGDEEQAGIQVRLLKSGRLKAS